MRGIFLFLGYWLIYLLSSACLPLYGLHELEHTTRHSDALVWAVTQEAKTNFGDHLIRRWGCGDDESSERSQRRTSDITSSEHYRNLYLHRRSWRHVLRVLLQHEPHLYCYAGVHCQRLPRCGWPWQASRWVALSFLWLIFRYPV